MESSEKHFLNITKTFSRRFAEVEPGKMMSSPGITYKGKVFSFFHNDKMVFRLGRNFDMEKANVSEYSLLSPFKNKPPLKDWFVISAADQSKWEDFAEIALKEIKLNIDK